MDCDVIIIGGGAAGLMCAIEAGKRGRQVMIFDHAKKLAEKIRISGGGRCNFTNMHCAPDKFICGNPHFVRSALSRFTQNDFLMLVKKYRIPYHEKALGQLFCDHSASDIINMLLDECRAADVKIQSGTSINKITACEAGGYVAETDAGAYTCQSLVIATGGLSIPKIGATGFGYDIARQFDVPVTKTRAGLVPLTFGDDMLEFCRDLSGLSVDPVEIKSESGQKFREAMLFTHRGLSGPAILQISSYWNPGEDITINLLPDIDVLSYLKEKRRTHAKSHPHTVLSELLPKRLVQELIRDYTAFNMADLPDKILIAITSLLTDWRVKPAGSEGYRTAEVTIGGVDTQALSSKTFECKSVPGLYFIGEVLDVTGHLGGYNFQWAWSSGWCAGQYV